MNDVVDTDAQTLLYHQKLALKTETGFRSPKIKFAENHIKAGGTGKTYMYYFAKKNTRFDWIGASHGCELPYVFHNFNGKMGFLL